MSVCSEHPSVSFVLFFLYKKKGLFNWGTKLYFYFKISQFFSLFLKIVCKKNFVKLYIKEKLKRNIAICLSEEKFLMFNEAVP